MRVRAVLSSLSQHHMHTSFLSEMSIATPSKNELARSCKIVHARLAWHVHAICLFSCMILAQSCTMQFLQDLAKSVQEMQVIILAATLAKSCTISCEICARLCKNHARKGTYRVHVPRARFLQDSCMILQVRFCWAGTTEKLYFLESMKNM